MSERGSLQTHAAGSQDGRLRNGDNEDGHHNQMILYVAQMSVVVVWWVILAAQSSFSCFPSLHRHIRHIAEPLVGAWALFTLGPRFQQAKLPAHSGFASMDTIH